MSMILRIKTTVSSHQKNFAKDGKVFVWTTIRRGLTSGSSESREARHREIVRDRARVTEASLRTLGITFSSK